MPLLVLRGDGGAMSIEAFRAAPSFTIGSGPAAGVAAALHQLSLSDGIVLECGGTSSNVSVVKGGRTVLRTLRVMGRPTSIRSVDSWVVGAAGGSLARLGRRKVEEAGPRSAHVAGLPYACFAAADELAGAELELVAPRDGDPEQYAVVVTPGGGTATRSPRRAPPTRSASSTSPRGHRPPARARRRSPPSRRWPAGMKRTPEEAARALLDRAVEKIAHAVADAARTHDFGPDVPDRRARRRGHRARAARSPAALGRPYVRPEHPEILSSIGAALSLVRTEIARHSSGNGDALALAREAERACVDAGAAPQTVRVETLLRGSRRPPARGRHRRRRARVGRRRPRARRRADPAAGRGLRARDGRATTCGSSARNDFYRVFCENGSGRSPSSTASAPSRSPRTPSA